MHLLPFGKLKRFCAACKKARADPPSSKQIKHEPEVKQGPSDGEEEEEEGEEMVDVLVTGIFSNMDGADIKVQVKANKQP